MPSRGIPPELGAGVGSWSELGAAGAAELGAAGAAGVGAAAGSGRVALVLVDLGAAAAVAGRGRAELVDGGRARVRACVATC